MARRIVTQKTLVPTGGVNWDPKKLYVESIPLEWAPEAWDHIMYEHALSKRMLLLVLDVYRYDSLVCSLAGKTLLDKYLLELNLHELEMIFRVATGETRTRAADSILRIAQHKDDLAMLIVVPNVHQVVAAKRLLVLDYESHDLHRCLRISEVAEQASAYLQSLSKKQQNSCDTYYGPRTFWRILWDQMRPHHLCRRMRTGYRAKRAFVEYKKRILAETMPPELVHHFVLFDKNFGVQLRQWLDQCGIEWRLSDEVNLKIWAMIKTSSPQFARLYVQ